MCLKVMPSRCNSAEKKLRNAKFAQIVCDDYKIILIKTKEENNTISQKKIY